jgi:hypothetical protein
MKRKGYKKTIENTNKLREIIRDHPGISRQEMSSLMKVSPGGSIMNWLFLLKDELRVDRTHRPHAYHLIVKKDEKDSNTV